MDKEIKILLISDVHLRLKNPRARTDNIEDVFRYKFKQLKKIIDDRDVKYVISGGDFMDVAKAPNEVLLFAKELVESLGVPLYEVVGNHNQHQKSLSNHNTTSIRILEMLCDNFNILPLDNSPVILDNLVAIHPRHYGDNNFICDEVEGVQNMIVSHATITTGYQMFDSLNADEIEHNSFILNGDIHYEYHTNNILSTGALVRLTKADHDMKREVAVHIMTVNKDGFDLERIPLKITPYQECFDYETVNKKQAQLDDVMKEKLNSAMTGVSDTKEIASVLAKEDKTEDEVLKCFNEYVGDRNEN